MRDGDERRALAISQRLGLPEIVGRILTARGVTLDEAELFLDPTVRDLLPDPAHLRDMSIAVERLVRAVRDGETIAVFGDYDVDGATSSALLRRYLSAIGATCRVYIPDRLSEGYGPNKAALLRLREEGVSVVVTVDCGTLAFEPLAEAKAAGLDVIVVDHHVAEPRLPEALAVINPNRLDEDSPLKYLAAVGVTFLLLIALNRELRSQGAFESKSAPDLLKMLDLVALGTVCDVVPLVGLNRALVRQGLKVMAQRECVGLRALSDVAGLKEMPAAYHLGFVLGPRVNAGGRVGEASLGADLLSTDDDEYAATIARKLDAFNEERRIIEANVLQDAVARAEAADSGPVLVVDGDGWHPGVIGIVASRLRERFNRPACVVALDGEKGLGSGRSVRGFDLGAAVVAARQEGLLINGGGHIMAAGFTVPRENVPALGEFLRERFERTAGVDALQPSLGIDGALGLSAATPELVETFEKLGPFGAGNPEPRFAFSGVRIVKADVVGEDHVRCILSAKDGARLKGISFRSLNTDLGRALLNHGGNVFHVVGRLKLNNWMERISVDLHIDDVARA